MPVMPREFFPAGASGYALAMGMADEVNAALERRRAVQARIDEQEARKERDRQHWLNDLRQQGIEFAEEATRRGLQRFMVTGPDGRRYWFLRLLVFADADSCTTYVSVAVDASGQVRGAHGDAYKGQLAGFEELRCPSLRNLTPREVLVSQLVRLTELSEAGL